MGRNSELQKQKHNTVYGRTTEAGEEQPKGGHIMGNGMAYPPININVHPSQSAAAGSDISAPQTDADPKGLSSLDIPGPG